MNAPSIEQELRAALLNEAECYEHAAAVVERLEAQLAAGGDGEALVRELHGWLAKTAAIQSSTAPARQAWQAAGARPGPELRSILDRVGGLLQRLMALVQAVERNAQVRRDQLLPELDAVVRGHRMQRAYGGAMQGTADPRQP